MSVDGVLSLFNPVIGALLRSPLHRLLSPGLLLLTVTGRHSGRRYAIPVGYQRDGDDLVVMVSEARRKQWWRNYYEPGPVDVRLRGQERCGRAELVAPGSDRFREIAERCPTDLSHGIVHRSSRFAGTLQTASDMSLALPIVVAWCSRKPILSASAPRLSKCS